MTTDLDMQEIFEVFFEESLEGIDAMESGLLGMQDGAADVETINRIFRAAHSIKGGGATFGFMEVSEFTHGVEAVLDEMRDGRRAVEAHTVDVLLQAVDCLRDMIAALRRGQQVDHGPVEAVRGRIQSLLDGASEAPDPSTLVDMPEGGWRISLQPRPEVLHRSYDPLDLFAELEQLGPLTVDTDDSALVDLNSLDPEQIHLRWKLRLHSAVARESIEAVFTEVAEEFAVELLCSTAGDVPPAHEDQTAAGDEAVPALSLSDIQVQAAEPTAVKAAATTEVTSIRVNTDKIDNLLNLVGELVITQSMLNQLGNDIHSTAADRLREGLAQLGRNTRELQEYAVQIRMLPIGFAFSRFPRLVRDLSRKLGKKVALEMSGETTELDKTVLEKIGDPLVHLVRNSLDHGLETPSARVAAGKPETGKVCLNAYHESGSIVIEIVDDGAGIDKQKVLDKARRSGLINANEQLTDEQIDNLIFRPGLSTADEVSDVSGRGVGMDVVRRNIQELGGNARISSTHGQGSKVTICLPLTLAILDGQLIRSGTEVYAVPLVSIIETLPIVQQQVATVNGDVELYRWRDDYLPILRLHELFAIEHDPASDEGLLMIAEAGDQRLAVVVDELLEQQQVVVKSMETNFKAVDGVMGATILGNGAVALIIDIPGLLQRFHDRGRLPRVA